jgi:hypothetical protein
MCRPPIKEYNTSALEDQGFYHDRNETVQEGRGVIYVAVYKHDELGERWHYAGGESINDTLGFEDDDHFSDNIF